MKRTLRLKWWLLAGLVAAVVGSLALACTAAPTSAPAPAPTLSPGATELLAAFQEAGIDTSHPALVFLWSNG